MLKGKKGLAMITSAANQQEAEYVGMLIKLEKSIVGVFSFFGFQEKKLHSLFAVTNVSDQERRLMLDEVRNLVNNYF